MSNAERKTQNAERKTPPAVGQGLGERLLIFGSRILRLTAALPRTEEGLHLRRQLLRSGTSCGANHCEARGAESRADFIHKMQIVLKELRETLYWLRLIETTGMVGAPRMRPIIQEAGELTAIVVKSLVTARGGRHGSA